MLGSLFPAPCCMAQLKWATVSLWEKLRCLLVFISWVNCLLFSTSQCQDWRWPVLYSTGLICPRTGLAFHLLFSFQLFISCIKYDWGLGNCSNWRAVLVQDIPSCWALMGHAVHLLDAFHHGCLNSTHKCLLMDACDEAGRWYYHRCISNERPN